MTARRRLPSTLAWAVPVTAAVGFAVLTLVVAGGWLDGFDRATGAVPLVPGAPAEEIFSAIALVTTPVLCYSVVLGYALWCLRRRLRNLATAMLLSIPVAWGGGWAWKGLLARPRPDSPHELITSLGYAYPSQHVAAIVVLVVAVTATLIHTRQPRTVLLGWRVASLALVAVVLLDRWIMSAHWISDLLGGALWGSAVVAAAMLACGVRMVPPELDRLLVAKPDPERALRTCAVVYNPARVTDWPGFRRRVEYELDARDYRPLWLETTAADPGRAMTRRAVAERVDLVLGAGGDGTIRIICDGLAGTGIPFGLIPAGTGNLLAKNLGIGLDESTALVMALDGVDTPVDLVRLTVDDRPPEHFSVMAGLGVDAVILAATNPELKRAVGSAAYFVSAARNASHPPVNARIRVDDGPELRRRASVIVLGNVGFLQGGIPLIPDAKANDGLLDLMVASPGSARDWARIVTRVLTRRERGDAQLDRITGRRVSIRIDRTDPYQLDGDTVGSCSRMVAEVAPGALTLRLPAGHRHGLVAPVVATDEPTIPATAR